MATSPPAPPIDLQVETRGGVEDLGRVVNALALYGLTPLLLRAERLGDGLRIRLRLVTDHTACSRFIGRLGALASVLSVQIVPEPVS